MILLRLFFEFFKTGLFSIGGGLATLPFLEKISAATGWFSHEELINMIAISEATPGPIGINMATYAGFLTAGAAGAVVATFGLLLPSLVITLVIARFLAAFRGNRWVEAVFYGIRPASMGMIAAAGYAVLRIALFRAGSWTLDWKALLLAAVLYAALANKKWKLHPVAAIAVSAVVGAVFKFGGA